MMKSIKIKIAASVPIQSGILVKHTHIPPGIYDATAMGKWAKMYLDRQCYVVPPQYFNILPNQ